MATHHEATHEALLYEKLDKERVHCFLCAHHCRIPDGKRGICQVRENRGGTLYSLVYGQLISEAVDPIEKKPLFHFYPGTTSFSIATVGCNFRCTFCQNADISQAPRDRGLITGRYTPPERVVDGARRHGCRSIAYTYTEPTIFFEYAYDVCQKAHEAGIANVFVSNGYMTAETLDYVTSENAAPLMDAANIDLKAFRDTFYREQCGARLQPVLDSLKRMKQRSVWVEVTTLVIPGLNDSDEELRDIARFVRNELGADTPWHVSRFHPTYRLMDRPPTPASSVRRAREIGLEEGLHYVYVGNLFGDEGEHTYCPRCGVAVIRRLGYTILEHDIRHGACIHCGAPIHGVGL
ncbi:MAG: AmmeMemoRadiSam system radical SAM enzyme [Chloroflexi bacterium]|nr:AmmeMemoRadiSam system radical SAM enzyme [Chloroflexota bacterium]